MKKLSVLILTSLFYVIFSFDLIIEPFNARLFANDFSEAGVADWLYFEIKINLFLICLGSCAVRFVNNEFIKRVFYAIIIDGAISLVRGLIFGYYEPDFIPPICNTIPLAIIFYSYFIYAKLD